MIYAPPYVTDYRAEQTQLWNMIDTSNQTIQETTPTTEPSIRLFCRVFDNNNANSRGERRRRIKVVKTKLPNHSYPVARLPTQLWLRFVGALQVTVDVWPWLYLRFSTTPTLMTVRHLGFDNSERIANFDHWYQEESLPWRLNSLHCTIMRDANGVPWEILCRQVTIEWCISISRFFFPLTFSKRLQK